MERKEPVIDSRAVDLTDRVKLTWRDVRTLADEAAATQPQIRADEPPAPEVLTTETAHLPPGSRRMSERPSPHSSLLPLKPP